jgi:hypothetical protein
MEEKKPQINNNGDEAKTIHTYLTDMAETVRNNEISVINIAVAEQKKHEREDIYRKVEGTNSTKLFLLIGGAILLLGTFVTIYFIIQKNKGANIPITNVISSKIETIISYDYQSFVDVTQTTNSNDFVKLLKPEILKVGNPDSIKSIFLTNSISGSPEILKLEDFTSLLGITAPPSLIRSLSGQYMIGTYTSAIKNSKPHLFLLFKVKDYDIVYAGMLQWEKTMLNDMFNLFNINTVGNISLSEMPFKDALINNKDMRVLYNDAGDNILSYVFIDKNNLIITDNQDTIEKVTSLLLFKSIKQ